MASKYWMYILNGHTIYLIWNLDFTHLVISYCTVQGIFLKAWLEHDSWCWFDCLKCAAIKDMKAAILAWDIPGELCWQPIEQTNGL